MINCIAPPIPVNSLSLLGHTASSTSGAKEEETLTYNAWPLIEIPTPQGTLQIKIYDTPPEWFNDVLFKLTRFLFFEPNWDSYGGQRIDIECVAAALRVLDKITDRETPEPDVVPTSNGGVQFEWSEKGIEIEIEILTPTRISWDYEEIVTGFSDEGEEATYNGLGKLISYVERLTTK